MFVFRRITADRFVHVGGAGRGEGWAGNIDLILRDEPRAAAAMADGGPAFVCEPEPVQIFGPYFQREAVLVPISGDLLVVFGSNEPGSLCTSAGNVTEAAQSAAEGVNQISSAKRLADELELLHAVHSMAQTNAVRIHEVMQHVVQSALTALSCDLGVIYVADLDALEVAEHEGRSQDPAALLPAMRALFEEAMRLPACVQDSAADPPPDPLDTCRVASHYVLPIGSPPFGVLALMHTEARPRGFTTLCREVGLRLAESAEPLLRIALTLHDLQGQLDRAGREARLDPLTRLPNRRAWDEIIEETAGTAGVIMVDADGLKVANDGRGHHFGDEFLQAVAHTVAEPLGEHDVLARIGGDEFAVLLPGADEVRCRSVAELVAQALATHPGLDGFPLSASVGYASYPPAGSLADAQRLADERMYETKQRPAA